MSAAATLDRAVRLVSALDDVKSVAQAGGKAWNLAHLRRLGLPVPNACVLTASAFDAFLAANGLHATVAAGDAARVRAKARAAALPDDIDQALLDAVASLPGAIRLAIRSSAAGEDGDRASFAGQLDTMLDVPADDPSAVRQAVLDCWASYWSDRSLAYRAARGTELAGMAVILQTQVRSAVSGVLFTRAPRTGGGDGRRESMLVEYVAGLGEGLVSGRLDPARLRIDRESLAVTVEVPLPDAPGSRDAALLATDARLAELGRLALRLERELGAPQDIEWTIDTDGRLWLLQSRPITTAAAPSPSASSETTLWSNANVSENFPDPISPLLYSIASKGYYHYFRNLGLAFGISRRRLAAMDRPLRGLIGVHAGRMYYNLTNIHAVLRMAPFGEALARAFNEFTGANEVAATPDGARTWRGERGLTQQAAEVARIGVRATWQFVWLKRRVRAFERAADAFAATTHPDALDAMPLDALLDRLSRFLAIRCHRWTNASLADTAAMVSYAMLQRSLAGAGAPPTLHTRLLRALPGVPSSQPALRLWDLSRAVRDDARLTDLFATRSSADVLHALDADPRFAAFRRHLHRYLDDWGFRSSSELMLTVPSLAERPAPVIDMLRQYARGDGEAPADAMARQAAERRAETRHLLWRLTWRAPHRALSVWRWLTWTQRAVAYRERVRLKQALLYSRCRRIALALGDRFVVAGRLAHRDDVFFLTADEILELGAGRAMFPGDTARVASDRRRQHAAFAAAEPPDTLRLPAGTYLDDAADAGARPAPSAARAADDESAGTVLRGASACGGRVSARAAVIADVSEADRLERGDVLVTRQTDPGWGPVLCLVSGLVIERGGMLSHGAIIAREFGLPCLVGVPNATTAIPHGATLDVDADAGTCRLITPHAAPPEGRAS